VHLDGGRSYIVGVGVFGNLIMRVLFALMLILSGCETYWVKTRPAQEILGVQYVDAPCGRADWSGCFSRSTSTIQIKTGLPEDERKCVLSHEMAHGLGWNHRADWRLARTDCGYDLQTIQENNQ
jgi:hypothetical protein